jgi:hypothetical protein
MKLKTDSSTQLQLDKHIFFKKITDGKSNPFPSGCVAWGHS